MDKRMSVYCIFTDSRGIVWLGTNNGLFFYDGVTTHPISETAISRDPVYAIIEQGDRLLIGTKSGLMTYTFSENAVDYYQADSPKEIRCMLLSEDRLWLGSIYGMYTVNLESTEISDVSEGLPHKSVYSILKDSRGILYAGTYDGLAVWDSSDYVFKEIDISGNQASGNLFVNCLLETSDHKNICIGTEGSLYVYTPMTGRCRKNPHMHGYNIKCMAESEENHFFVGTDSGIFELNDNDIKHYVHDLRQDDALSNNEIWCLHTDGTNIMAGHEVGFSVASSSNAIRSIKLSRITHSGEGNDIHTIYRDSKNVLWFSGTNGIIKLEGNGKTKWFKASGKHHSLSHNHIRAIKEDSHGTIWLGTDGGLNRYNPETDSFDVFHIVDKNGKHSSNWVYAIEEDGENFIIGSYLGGLHQISGTTLKNSRGGIIFADESTNRDSPVFKGLEIELNNDLINKVIKDPFGNIWILCFSDDILTKVTADGIVKKFDIGEMAGNQPNALALDNKGRLWCAFKGGAAVFSEKDSCRIVRFPKTDNDESTLAIATVGNDMWISTVSNVWSVDGNTGEANLLPIPQNSYKSIFEDTLTHTVYLGGNDEIVKIDPLKLGDSADKAAIRMVLTDVNNGVLDLSKLVPPKEGLTIPYGGSLTLIVSNLDYSPGASQRYLYKLAKSQEDTVGRWIVLPENFNTVSLPELKMGNYAILIRSVGTLNPAYALPLHVCAPWYLSWWAFSLYFIALFSIILAIILYMHKRNIKLNQEEDRRKALENVERKLTFLSGISHDLKTPLSMIMGPASILKGKTADKEIRKNLDLIYENAVKLNNMIHRTLEISYIDQAGESSLILSSFDAVNLCRSIFETFKGNHPQKKFLFHASEAQILIEADAVKFESIITNLFSNACKYSDADSTISCGVCRIDRNIHIIVSDDGIGIDEIDQPLVFQRMFRAPSSSKMREGTGIGLYLTRQYIELMKGKIELYSTKGKGTSFIVTLPLPDMPAVKQKEVDINNTNHKKPKILIVEDNQQISDFIYDLLKKDYICLSAENGRTGLSIAESFTPDLIISDELMPVMNGMEMIEHLKRKPRLSDIPIIMLTAKSDNDTENRSIRAGVDIFMAKPFEASMLLGRIKHLIEQRSKIQETIRIKTITEVKPIEAESVSEKQLAAISKAIEENISDPDLNVNRLCEICGMTSKQLYRIIKKYMGVGPLDYIRNVRLQKAAMLLGQKRFTVSEVSYMVGFRTPSYFTKCFQECYGVKPSQYEGDQ